MSTVDDDVVYTLTRYGTQYLYLFSKEPGHLEVSYEANEGEYQGIPRSDICDDDWEALEYRIESTRRKHEIELGGVDGLHSSNE